MPIAESFCEKPAARCIRASLIVNSLWVLALLGQSTAGMIQPVELNYWEPGNPNGPYIVSSFGGWMMAIGMVAAWLIIEAGWRRSTTPTGRVKLILGMLAASLVTVLILLWPRHATRSWFDTTTGWLHSKLLTQLVLDPVYLVSLIIAFANTALIVLLGWTGLQRWRHRPVAICNNCGFNLIGNLNATTGPECGADCTQVLVQFNDARLGKWQTKSS